MTALADILRARIAAAGPMTLADYMAECLLHPKHGYYTTRDPFGAAGDFITAPEISQMFGELIGLCLAQVWLDQGQPASIVLAELGPGRGTLMADLLRATRGVPGFHAALRICLVEASPVLQALQAQSSGRFQRHLVRLGAGPACGAALPDCQRILRRPAGSPVSTRRTGLARADGRSGRRGRLGFGLGPEVRVGALDHRLADVTEGEIVEMCPAAGGIVAEISARIAGAGGAALIVDYGGWGSRGDTFQALKSNAYADPFAEPGQADLTAHVDFAALAAASPLAHHFATQGAFLGQLGIGMRAERLARGLQGAALQSHLAAAARLTDDAEMGTLFKALVLYPAACPPPPGFA